MPGPVDNLIANNRRWVEGITAGDPQFFSKLEGQQKPQYMWIGCCDSRVPANEIIGLMPGEVFVHRNVGNVVLSNDLNCMSAVQYAVEVLGIRHIIVCGHYSCGGVNASMEEIAHGLIDYWIWPIKLIQRKHPWLATLPMAKARDVLCELNVLEQVGNLAECKVLKRAWAEGNEIDVHGWIYGVGNGRLRDLGVRLDRDGDVRALIDAAELKIKNQALST
ncbi:MAG: carbonic anhydrase [Planctomycetota bacterium]